MGIQVVSFHVDISGSSFGHRFSHKSRVRSNSSVLPLPKISALGELQLDGETCRSAFVPRTEVLEPQAASRIRVGPQSCRSCLHKPRSRVKVAP